MKIKEIYAELIEAAKRAGVKVRSEKGGFRGGACVVNDRKLIVLNSAKPLETRTRVLAACVKNFELDDVFLKPAVRDFMESEILEDKGESYEIAVGEELEKDSPSPSSEGEGLR